MLAAAAAAAEVLPGAQESLPGPDPAFVAAFVKTGSVGATIEVGQLALAL